MLLGVNIDHVATLRQARGTSYPEPVKAALLVESHGADSITIHLREDRRHIQDADVYEINRSIRTRLNLEMAVTDEMIAIAMDVQPADVCLVPEKREELTTEGGLDVAGNLAAISDASKRLSAAGIRVSLFIDPDEVQIDAALECGAPVIEIHTGSYADASGEVQLTELERVRQGSRYAASKGLVVNAGHGLNLANVTSIAAIPEIVELNIGHSLVSDAVFSGLGPAVAAMKKVMLESRS